VSVKQLVTAEEFWDMPEAPGVRYELVNGAPVKVAGTGVQYNLLVNRVSELLRTFVRKRGLGLVLTDGAGHVIRRNPDRVIISDVSFVAWDSLPSRRATEGYCPVPPDIAIDVASPNDRQEDVHGKVQEYLDAGSRLVIALWPTSRSVTVYTPGVVAQELGADDYGDFGAALPPFRAKVADIFDVQLEG